MHGWADAPPCAALRWELPALPWVVRGPRSRLPWYEPDQRLSDMHKCFVSHALNYGDRRHFSHSSAGGS